MKLDLFEYQTKAMNTCMDSSRNMSYMALGLMSEVGEFTGKIAKAIRKGNVYIGKEIQGNIDCKNDSDLHFDFNAFQHNGQAAEERSMISPDYARNFICDFILGKPQPEICPTLFDAM